MYFIRLIVKGRPLLYTFPCPLPDDGQMNSQKMLYRNNDKRKYSVEVLFVWILLLLIN
jgi:hypothetical protein